MNFCPHCGSRIQSKSTFCAKCGKVLKNQDFYLENRDDNVIKEIFFNLIKWLGIVIFVLCIVSFFIDSSWLIQTLQNTIRVYSGHDSDASMFLFKLEINFLNFAIFLKELPLFQKVLGLVIGGALFLFGAISED